MEALNAGVLEKTAKLETDRMFFSQVYRILMCKPRRIVIVRPGILISAIVVVRH